MADPERRKLYCPTSMTLNEEDIEKRDRLNDYSIIDIFRTGLDYLIARDYGQRD
jgi:hypothetical protein